MDPDVSAEAPQPVDPSVLLPAKAALERGDYGTCQQLLEPLLERHSVSTPFGGEVRLLLATAQLGRGDTKAAAATCRSLRACRDATLRAQAKDLQEVLDAPALVRPREWSMTLPTLGEMQPLEGELKAMVRQRRRRAKPPAPPPPPTGPTQAPLGFGLLVVILLVLTALLGGCADLQTTLRFPAPGRMQLLQTSQSLTDQPLPWQRQWASQLRGSPLKWKQDHGRLSLTAPVLPAQQTLELLRANLESSAALAGVALPEPTLRLEERNWLLGVVQRFEIQVDLSELQPLPGLQLTLRLEPMGPAAVQRAEPLAPRPQRGALVWSLQPGSLNQLETRCWRWSRLGLGALLIVLLLAAVALLQRLRLAAGFGLPQLPA
ncbi:DUF3153 domain-containing protein [Vulcanococcus sp.]|jgi:hypothetical protein|uniref:DUF3153 domain-containing protein n=1 Tax=Vulcanococcus sp. TaxID=2856995 RepID=UPI003C01A3CB